MGVFNEILSKFRGSTASKRPPLEGAYIYVLAALIGFTVADLSVINIRPSLLPKEAPPSRPKQKRSGPLTSRGSYSGIATRNIFNADGKIPPALSSGDSSDKQQETDGPAVLSKLPLKLLGTIVHINPAKSVATVSMGGANKTSSFQLDDEIESMAKITKVERRKLTFRNLNNRRMEYIEIPEESSITFGRSSPKKKSAGMVNKQGEFSFTLDRSTLDKYTSDLSNILKQARMTPNIVPGSGGQVEGFRFVRIQPDSIYEKLGFKANDIIKEVNGDKVNSPTKAMELYNTLKTSDDLTLSVERNGRLEEFKYNIQ